MNNFPALRAILTAGLVVGVVDISSAFVIWWQRGVALRRGLQGIAAGLLGTKAFEGGLPTAALGLALHFFVRRGIGFLPGESQDAVFDPAAIFFGRALRDRRLHCDVLDRVAVGILNISTPDF
jgi:hypothetical protein